MTKLKHRIVERTEYHIVTDQKDDGTPADAPIQRGITHDKGLADLLVERLDEKEY